VSTEIQSAIRTVSEVMSMMAAFAGGSIPSSTDAEYLDWLRWIQQKQEEYARRAFWRRCLTRVTLTLDGETTLLPDRFHKPNGLYMVVVDGIDWMDPDNEDGQYVFVEMDNAVMTDDAEPVANTNFGKWQMRFKDAPDSVTATVWYFSNPPKPTATTDILLLPGDMVGYAALGEYYRTSGAEGSQDKAESDAEARFQEYLMLEVIPGKNDLMRFERSNTKTDRLAEAKNRYRTRPYRNVR
jgi:hypothetical protein